MNKPSTAPQKSVAQLAEAVEYLCRGIPPPLNECSGYIKQFDGEAPVMLELWIMQSTPSLL